LVTLPLLFQLQHELYERLVIDAFVAKLNAEGKQLVYSTYLGGNGEDRALRIQIDIAGNAYITGDTDSANFPTVNALQAVKGGSADAFVIKLNSEGTAMVFSTFMGGIGIDGGAGIALDAASKRRGRKRQLPEFDEFT
jgi:hypothetical protein